MRKRRLVVLIIVCAIGIALWILSGRSYFGTSEKVVPRLGRGDVGRTNPPNSKSNSGKGEVSESINKLVGINEDIVPIVFYGKVVDENESPVVQADIEFGVNDSSKDGSTKYRAQSDSMGLFLLEGVRGGGTTVQVSKEGYYKTRSGAPYFYYSPSRLSKRHIPDADNPVVFRLKKKGEINPLIKRYSKVPLLRDGTPVRFDFIEGEVLEKGQMEIRAWKSENKDVRQHFDWRMIISIPGGGLKETSEEFPFLAPETGYTESLEVNMPASLGDQWQFELEKQLYVVFGNPPKYARINFRTSGMGAHVFMDYWLNPAGSRNLEYDEAKRINK